MQEVEPAAGGVGCGRPSRGRAMVETASTMRLPLGTRALAFRLLDPSGREWTLGDFEGRRALLVAFLCNHCPFVKHIREGLAQLAKHYETQGVGVIAINSNDYRAYPEDRPGKMVEEAEAAGYTFPYVIDETQAVAREYGAACTPDFFLFDADRHLVYRGQMDGSRPGNGVPVTGTDLRNALEAVLSGRPVSADQRPSLGCNIKWKPGNAPEYFRS